MQDKQIKTEAQLTISMPIEEARLFRNLCKETGVTITTAARRAIRAYIPAMQRVANELHSATEGMASVFESVKKDGME